MNIVGIQQQASGKRVWQHKPASHGHVTLKDRTYVSLNQDTVRFCGGAASGQPLSSDRDYLRYYEIATGKNVSDQLRDYLMSGDAQIGEDDSLRMPLKLNEVKFPRFEYGSNQGQVGNSRGNSSGQGSGQGQSVGQPQGNDQPQQGQGQGKGNGPVQEGDQVQDGDQSQAPEGDGEGGDRPGKGGGDKDLEHWEFSAMEVAKAMRQKLRLPELEPSSQQVLKEPDDVLTSRKPRPRGPIEMLATRKNAVRAHVAKRQVEGRPLDFNDMEIQKPHLWYKDWKTQMRPSSRAVFIMVRDSSGSMTELQLKLTKLATYIIFNQLKDFYGRLRAKNANEQYSLSHYQKAMDEVYIDFNSDGKEVSKKEFYAMTSGNGTDLYKGLEEAIRVIEKRYSPKQGWNVYLGILSDGEVTNSDMQSSNGLLKNLLDMGIRRAIYFDVEPSKGVSDNYGTEIAGVFGRDPRVRVCQLFKNDDIPEAARLALEPNNKVRRGRLEVTA